jgi:hypothetical protein
MPSRTNPLPKPNGRSTKPRARQPAFRIRGIAPGGHVSCSFLALILKKELEERIADLGRNGS